MGAASNNVISWFGDTVSVSLPWGPDKCDFVYGNVALARANLHFLQVHLVGARGVLDLVRFDFELGL